MIYEPTRFFIVRTIHDDVDASIKKGGKDSN